METVTMTLTEWLLTQIAEDEAVASAVAIAPWHSNGGHFVENHTWIAEVDCPEDAVHIARHDPARVLAECEAKRAIVEAHPIRAGWEDADMNDRGAGCETCGHSEEYSDTGGACETLRILATVYSDHPDYREEWKP
jgi:hypothetical protein